jgi:hypothetical protein
MIAPRALYASDPDCIIVLFNTRASEAIEQLYRDRTTWEELSDIEALSEDCFALILRSGGARSFAA